jgi:inorganic triphosphatase YgiF
MPAEIELKLALDPAALARLPQLLRCPAVRAVKRGRARTTRLVSTYYDTVDARLARAGVALRLRRDGARWLQAVKGPPLAGNGAGLHARSEFEAPVAGAMLDPTQFAATPWAKLLAKTHARNALGARFTTDFERTTIPLEFPDGSFALLCADVGTIRAGRRSLPIAEIELELEAGHPQRLFELGLALAAGGGVGVAVVSKAERGFALRAGRRDGWSEPARAAPPPLARDVDAASALAAILRECLHQIAANAAGLAADDDPEWVHQMRIGTRRLRSCLALAAPFAPPHELDALLGQTKALAAALGPARDWDVFATETLPPLARWFAADAGTAPGLARLEARLAPARRHARRIARDAIRAPAFAALLLRAGALAATPRLGAGHPPAGADPLAQPARAFAATLLARRHRRLVQRGDRLATATTEERHAVRIAAKKVRYAAEFFAPLFAPKRTRAFLKALGRLQDALGHWNDAATAMRLAAELAGDDHGAAAGAVKGWAAARAAALDADVGRAWTRFAAAPRFWTRD